MYGREIKEVAPDTWGAHYLDAGSQSSEKSWQEPNPVAAESIQQSAPRVWSMKDGTFSYLLRWVVWDMLQNFSCRSIEG